MSYWLTDPELFLYAKGIDPDDVHLWRCNKPASSSSSSSSLVVPMESDDFDYVSKVENHVELIGDMFDWDEPDYKRLVKYIYEKHLLINSQGFVIAAVLHEVDKDGNKKIDDADKEEKDVPGIYYIRSLDVLPLKPYIPKLRKRPIPLRTIKYLGDLNGKVAMMEGDSQVTKLTTRVENLEAGSTRLESKNNTLDTSLSKLTTGLATTIGNVDDLQSKNKALEAENKALDSNVKTLEGKVTKLTADLVTQMNALTTLQTQLIPVWMTNLTNSEWVGVEELIVASPFDNFIVVGTLGTFTSDENNTNVRARYWHKIQIVGFTYHYTAVFLEDLTPNKEMAKFSKAWVSFKSKGKAYVFRQNDFV